MKKLSLLILILLTLCLTACGQDTTQIAKDEFSKYYNGKNEVVLNLDDTIYFEKTELNLNKLIKGNEPNLGLIIKKDTILFSTSVQNSMFDYTLNICECNFEGTDIKLLFSKAGFKTHPWAYAIDDIFYIEHYTNNALDANSKLVDKYTISTGEYENIASGKDCSLSDYFKEKEQSKYSVEVIEDTSPQKHGKFIITDSETGLKKTIDDDYLKNTIYIESMEKFNYGPKRFDISNGRILLTYSIGAGDGWNNPHLVFEYDFNSNTLEYKLLAFPYDNLNAEIFYIG